MLKISDIWFEAVNRNLQRSIATVLPWKPISFLKFINFSYLNPGPNEDDSFLQQRTKTLDDSPERFEQVSMRVAESEPNNSESLLSQNSRPSLARTSWKNEPKFFKFTICNPS